jgi:hypothetical protein
MDQEQEFLQSLSGLRDQLLDILKDYWIFSIPYSLGEVAIAGALAKSFKQQYGGPLAFLVDPAKMGVAQLFADQVDVAVPVPMHLLRNLNRRGFLSPETFRRGSVQDVYEIHGAKLNFVSLVTLRNQHPDRGLPVTDVFRFAMRLPWEAPLHPGRPDKEALEQAERIAASVGMEPGNSVILFPGNNTNLPAPSVFWKRVAKEAAAAGKRVFVNVSGAALLPDDLDVPGIPVELNDIPQAIALCEIAGRIVAGSNGFLMTALLTETRFGLDVILTDAFDPTASGRHYQPMPIRSGSLFLQAPEIKEDIDRPYREWEVPSSVDTESIAVELVRAWSAGNGSPS